MCRNIRVLHNFAPPSTDAEIRAAALQFVRKVSGLAKPRLKELELLEHSAAIVAAETKKLLKTLPKSGTPRTREGEVEKARTKWRKREEQMFARLRSRDGAAGQEHLHDDGAAHTHEDGTVHTHAHDDGHAHTHEGGPVHSHAHDEGHAHTHEEGTVHPHAHHDEPPHGDAAAHRHDGDVAPARSRVAKSRPPARAKKTGRRSAAR